MLYDYLMGAEFSEQWKAIREGFMSMKLSIQRERDAMDRAARVRQITERISQFALVTRKDKNVCALSCEQRRSRTTNPGAATGDDNVLSPNRGLLRVDLGRICGELRHEGDPFDLSVRCRRNRH